jgi:group II intron reverse transcriptase/maturase
MERTMENTPRSQTISTENRTIVEQATHNTNSVKQNSGDDDKPPVLVGEVSLNRIAMLAKNNPEMSFTSLAHRVDLSLLREAFRRIKKGGAAGVDKVTAADYVIDLDQNLYNLHQRLCRGQYVATPVKRIWIEKENGKQRPIGIPAFEDKIVQKAVEMILSAIYESNFYDFSHGFRSGHNQHMAIRELQENCRKNNTNWIVSADITGLFDNIDHGYLRELLKLRVNDGGIIRLIGKWLNAGVMEEGRFYRSDSGTPQGGVISPVLSNIFLHYVLDDWFVREVQPRMKGRSFLIRFADDYITGFELESDAKRALEAMKKRFDRFGLELHPDKTKLLFFGRPTHKNGKANQLGTFDFLGFTFYRGISRRGNWVIMKKTAQKRLSRFHKMVWDWCKKNRHKSLQDQYATLCSKLRGYYQYFGVICNYKAIARARYYTRRSWRYWLCRRSHKGKIKYEDLENQYPLPKPRIVHNF